MTSPPCLSSMSNWCVSPRTSSAACLRAQLRTPWSCVWKLAGSHVGSRALLRQRAVRGNDVSVSKKELRSRHCAACPSAGSDGASAEVSALTATVAKLTGPAERVHVQYAPAAWAVSIRRRACSITTKTSCSRQAEVSCALESEQQKMSVFS